MDSRIKQELKVQQQFPAPLFFSCLSLRSPFCSHRIFYFPKLSNWRESARYDGKSKPSWLLFIIFCFIHMFLYYLLIYSWGCGSSVDHTASLQVTQYWMCHGCIQTIGRSKLYVCVCVCVIEITLALLSLYHTCGGKPYGNSLPTSFQWKNMEFGEILIGAHGVISLSS